MRAPALRSPIGRLSRVHLPWPALAVALALALTLALALPAVATAQSYLSELQVRPRAAERAPTFGTAQPELALLPVEELFALVERGRGREAYPVLRARFEDAMLTAARTPGVDADALRKTYLMQLLRAGEGVATPAEQERTARAFVDYYPDDRQFPLVFYFLNESLFRQHKPLEESYFFDQQALETLPAWIQTRFLRMLAASEERSGRYASAAASLVLERESAGTLRQTAQSEVEELLERLRSPAELEAFLAQHAEVAWLQRRAPFLQAKVLLNEGRLDQALLKLEAILAEGRATSAADLKIVNELKLDIRARVATRPDRIGVLLPLGSSAQVLRDLALETLEGLRMAVQFPALQGPATAPLSRLLAQDLATGEDRRNGAATSPAPRFELVVRDTANSPVQAAKQVEELVHDDQVIAIIGPIARTESGAAAAKAEELGVPLISLSLSVDIPPDARFVFRHSKSQEEEVRDLVRYAVHYLHARRFAILYPDTSYGHTMSGLFWQEAERHGGAVVAVSSFEPSVRVTRLSRDRVGFKEIFQRFTGMDRSVSPDEKALLDAVGDTNPDPIVDFDALYIPIGPDGVQDLQLIAPYPVTVDAEHVQLLGSRFWNDASVLVAGDGKLDGAVFVDAFDLTSANPKVAAFQTRHRTFYGQHAQYRPPTYYAGLGYDTANLLLSLLQERRNRDRAALREALVHMEPFFGVTGWTRFNAQGESEKESMFFRIDGNEILRVVP